MTEAAVAADLHEALDVLGNLAVQVALHLDVLLDVVAQLGQIVLREVLDADVGIHAGFGEDLFGGGQTDTVDVGQADFNALVARKVDTNKTSHR